MTDQRLRDLLHESVSDTSMPDVAEDAWRSAIHTRRRRTAGVAAAATACVVGVAGALTLVDRGPNDPGPTTGRPSHASSTAPSPSTSTAGGSTPDATVHGVSVWWGPTLSQEADLPTWDSPLPTEIDVWAPATDLSDDPVDRALAAFAVFSNPGVERVVVVAPDGSLRQVDVTGLRTVAKPNGYLLYPETQSMLSPSGQYLVFPQDHGVKVLTLGTGQWHTVATGAAETAYATWISDRTFYLPQTAPEAAGPSYDVGGRRAGYVSRSGSIDLRGLGRADGYGRLRMSPGGSARAFYVPPGPVSVPPGGVHTGQAIVVQSNGGPADRDLLRPGDEGSGERWKDCCSVAGWLDPHTVVYESAGVVPRLVAWRVGTHAFGQLTTVTGLHVGHESYVASWARLWSQRPLG